MTNTSGHCILRYCASYSYYCNMEDTKPGYKDLMVAVRKKRGSVRGFGSAFFRYPGMWLILISNLAVFFIPGLDISRDAYTLLWIYLSQSILIGFLHFCKLLFYKFAPASGPSNWINPRAIALFFLVHFGFFHAVYAMFIPPSKADWIVVVQGAAIFFCSLILNTLQNWSVENSGKYKANEFMFFPYLRIIPIHIAIILGGFLGAVSGNAAPIFYVLVGIKILLELVLEYFHALGLKMSDVETVDD